MASQETIIMYFGAAAQMRLILVPDILPLNLFNILGLNASEP